MVVDEAQQVGEHRIFWCGIRFCLQTADSSRRFDTVAPHFQHSRRVTPRSWSATLPNRPADARQPGPVVLQPNKDPPNPARAGGASNQPIAPHVSPRLVLAISPPIHPLLLLPRHSSAAPLHLASKLPCRKRDSGRLPQTTAKTSTSPALHLLSESPLTDSYGPGFDAPFRIRHPHETGRAVLP